MEHIDSCLFWLEYSKACAWNAGDTGLILACIIAQRLLFNSSWDLKLYIISLKKKFFYLWQDFTHLASSTCRKATYYDFSPCIFMAFNKSKRNQNAHLRTILGCIILLFLTWVNQIKVKMKKNLSIMLSLRTIWQGNKNNNSEIIYL